MACSTCHSVGDRPATIGPDLTRIDSKTSDAELTESVLLPSKKIAKGYASVTIETADGRVIIGLPIEETAARLVLRDAAQPDKVVALEKREIEQRHETQQSIMPAGQVNQLADRQQFLDLIRFLIELRDGGSTACQRVAAAAGCECAADPRRPVAVAAGGATGRSGRAWQHQVPARPWRWDLPAAARSCSMPTNWARLRSGLAASLKARRKIILGCSGIKRRSGRGAGAGDVQPLGFQWSNGAEWQGFEPPTRSDPNVGTRFDGYQIGKIVRSAALSGLERSAADRCQRGRAGRVSPSLAGIRQRVRFAGLPAGAQRGAALPEGSEYQCYSAAGKQAAADGPLECRAAGRLSNRQRSLGGARPVDRRLASRQDRARVRACGWSLSPATAGTPTRAATRPAGNMSVAMRRFRRRTWPR